ncbi:MAG TPA: lipoprotein [Usitatibacter sp.]|nr:lipoprotein [Usitatibacter sp.]
MIRAAPVLAVLLLLAACGQKGPLKLPAPAPAVPTPVPAAPPSSP